MSAGRVARRSPLLGGLHRLLDGTMFGVLAAVAVLAGLTLHWQHRWTLSFNRLESTRSLAHRLTESTAVLEQHLLQHSERPSLLVPTKVANLVYLNRPSAEQAPPVESSMIPSFDELIEQRIRPGY